MTFGTDFPFGGRPPGSGDSDADGPPPGEPRRKRSPLMATLIVLAVLVVAFVFFANTYAEVLWFNQLGYSEVFWTQKLTQIAIFVVAFLLMGVGVWASLRIAYRSRPIYASAAGQNDILSRYQSQLEPMRRLLMVGVPAVLAAFSGAAVASQWDTVLLYLHQQPFGEVDPEFGMDLSFFLNTLPFLGLVLGYLVSVVLIGGIAGILMHYLYGGIQIEERGSVKVTKAARLHIVVVVALFLLLQAGNYWLDRYSTLLAQDGRVAGALYTDVNAVIPTKTILAVAAVLVAVLFIVGGILGRWKLPIVGTAMLVVTAIVAGGVYPFVVQQYQVVPSEKTREREYIAKNIEMTRQAYGIDDVQADNYDATTDTAQNALAADSATTTNIRLLDPNLVSDAFSQLQQFRPYYQFAETLDVDRYEIDGEMEDTVIAVRDVNVDTDDSWVNQHITYTHGYGVVAAYGAQVAAGGRPDFSLGGIPTTGELASEDDYEPRIYFGEFSPEYSIVGGPEGWEPRELDRPQDESGEGDANTTFSGDGGPNVGNPLNRLVYALKFGSTDLLLSSDVNAESQILYDRNPKERVEKVAPYLTVDSNSYPAIVDGRVKWIVDAYTTSDNFPYSQAQRLESAVTDSLSDGERAVTASGQVNYIRNSVKATVDAYDGSVDLFAWDPEEPLLKAWQSVFPTSIKPYSEMSADLMAHVRYPEDMFKIQREVLGKYHVTDPDNFYESNDAWQVPSDPTSDEQVKQPPYYLSMKMPKQEEETFSLTSTFIPQGNQSGNQRNVLYGFLAADSDAGGEAGKKAEGYGTLRLLELPRSTVIPGPGQAQQNFDSNTAVSQELNLLRQGASTVINGNLLTLPVGGGILHVQPVYVQSTGQTAYPTLRKVLVSFGDKVGFADTLSGALDQLFDGASGAETSEGEGGGTGEEAPGEDPAAASAEQRLKDALAAANSAIQAGQAALAEGDFAEYGEQQKILQDALQAAMDADAELTGEPVVPEDEEAPASESPAPEGEGGNG
ncbi:UPF0182 family protein [Zhihengliuella alba]|uniref:UPF0182 protein GCM10022377_07100 n=1 Tax=Zhihengliuella alba TaxID=547018 RepID=A0ABP7CZV5_9MICC